MKFSLASTVAFSALAACGGDMTDPVENKAAQLEEAADQSDPAAAAVLDNAADQVLQQNSIAPAQNVMQEAGNAQAPGLRAPERSDPLPPKEQLQPPIASE